MLFLSAYLLYGLRLLVQNLYLVFIKNQFLKNENQFCYLRYYFKNQFPSSFTYLSEKTGSFHSNLDSSDFAELVD